MLDLAPDEAHVLQDTAYFEARARLEGKLTAFFQSLQGELMEVVAGYKDQLPSRILSRAPKYTRGEKYQGLPYRVLDCPNLLDRDTYFAYRCVLIWGRGWSTHFMLKGGLTDSYRKALAGQLDAAWYDGSVHGSLGESPWQWLQDATIQPLDTADAASNYLLTHPFVKLSRFWPIGSHETFRQAAPAWLGALLQAAIR